jgi:hypothetical protein
MFRSVRARSPVPPPNPMYVDVFNATQFLPLDRADFYETMHFLTAMQGIVNRFVCWRLYSFVFFFFDL